MNPILSALYSGILCSLLGGWVGYRLRIGGEALDRRRVLRIRLREMALEALTVHPLHLVEFQRRITAEFQHLRLSVLEDLPLWRQRRFQRRCLRFLALDAASLTPQQAEDDKQAFQTRRIELARLLESIARAG